MANQALQRYTLNSIFFARIY